MNSITTHVLDTSIGKPAAGVLVKLERRKGAGEWEEVGRQMTDNDGRARDLMPEETVALTVAPYRLTFDVGAYFTSRSIEGFYRHVMIEFVVYDASQHYHVPLLVSPFGYSTYRGS